MVLSSWSSIAYGYEGVVLKIFYPWQESVCYIRFPLLHVLMLQILAVRYKLVIIHLYCKSFTVPARARPTFFSAMLEAEY
jgi:hypothetical protein